MKTASDYDVYFPFGATSSPYSPSHPHRGDDRCNKFGVPVVVEGIQIGLTGATGLVYDALGNKGTPGAAHLHVQEYHGNPANVRKPQNSFKGGVVVAATSSSDFGNYVTIQTDDGWMDSYCHLSRIDVRLGQIIGEVMSKVNDGDTMNYFLALFDRQPDQAELDKNRGKEWNSPDPKFRAPLYDDMIGRGRYLTEENKRLQKLLDNSGTPSDATILNPGYYKVGE